MLLAFAFILIWYQDTCQRFGWNIAILVQICDEEMKNGRIFLWEVERLGRRFHKTPTKRLAKPLSLEKDISMNLV